MPKVVTDASQLDYAPAAPVRRQRRVRRFVVALMLLAMAAALWRAGPPFARQVRYVYWQHKCMTFAEPAEFVTYEEEPTRAATLLNKPQYVNQPGAAAFCPPPSVGLLGRMNPALFLPAR